MTRLRRSWRLALVVIVAILAGWYASEHRAELALVLDIRFAYLPALLAVPLFAIAVNGRIMQRLVGYFGTHLRWSEAYVLTTMHSFANYLPVPQAGAMARGLYLKRAHGLDLRSFVASVLVTYVQFLCTVGVIGLAVLAVAAVGGDAGSPAPLWLLFVGLAAAGPALPWLARAGARIRRVAGLADPIRVLSGLRTVLMVSSYQTLLIALHALGLWLAFASLGRPLSLSGTLIITLVSMASGVINVTPGNLGVAESAAWVTAQAIGTDPDVAVIAYAVFRLTSLVPVLVLTPWFAARFKAPPDAAGVMR